jgi:hypothetical protein
MNPIATLLRRTKELRPPRRSRRVAELGGYPAAGPQLAVEPFEPELNHQHRLVQALEWVSRLGPDSVDEGTGHPLDNLVNAHSDDWQRRLDQQYQAYMAMARSRRRQAMALVEQYRRLGNHDLKRLEATETAVEESMLALSGEPPGGSVVWETPRPARAGGRNGTQPAGARRRGSADTGQRDVLTEPAALAPPRVSRTELRRIFDPADARRVPHWQEPGFRDPALLGGRPRGAYVHVIALLLAAGADLGAFTQVVELALPEQSNLIIYLVVGGLTAVVLYIAHMIGVMLREAKARYAPGVRSGLRLRSWLAIRATVIGCAVVWAAVGLLAYWVRTTVPLIGTTQLGGGIGAGVGSGIGGGSAAPGTSGAYNAQSAAIFLGLYLCTGIVAAVGAYFSHNPYRGRYMTAMRAYRKASERAAASSYQFMQAHAVYDRQQAEVEAAPEILANAKARERAFSEQLKQSIRVQIASMARDPAVTDAIFRQDQKPYWSGQIEPPPADSDEE